MACSNRTKAKASGNYLKSSADAAGDLSGSKKKAPPLFLSSALREFDNDVYVGNSGIPFSVSSSAWIYDPGSYGTRGYHLCINGNQNYGIIPSFSASRTDASGSQSNTAYCLNHDLQFGSVNPSNSTSIGAGLAGNGSLGSAQCAITWLLANGYYDEETSLAEFFDKLSVVIGTDSEDPDTLRDWDAQYLTQAAIWYIIDKKQRPSAAPEDLIHFCSGAAPCTTCGIGSYDPSTWPGYYVASPILIDKMNTALEKLVQLAMGHTGSGCGKLAQWNPDDFPQPTSYNAKTLLAQYKKPSALWREPGKKSRASGSSAQMGSNCSLSEADISVCGEDSLSMDWGAKPTSARMICGRLVVGPMSVNSSGGDPTISTEPCCACSDGFSSSYVDVCGNAIENPSADEEIYTSLRVTGRTICYRTCASTEGPVDLEEHRVYFIDTGGYYTGPPDNQVFIKYQNLGTRFLDKHHEDAATDEACMMICVKVDVGGGSGGSGSGGTAEGSVVPNLPPPMPLFYPPLRLPPPPPIPPLIIESPPIVMQAQMPKVTLPTPPQQVLVAPPPPQRPPIVINSPPIVTPPPPAPPAPRRYIDQPPVLYSMQRPMPPPRPIPPPPPPLFINMPPRPPAPPYPMRQPPVLINMRQRTCDPPCAPQPRSQGMPPNGRST
ncbi:MAG: thioester domain-containing protein [Oscillospiraceae bacterium]|jgi:TQXA domain-containing protein|nr:thioester domain-containing protein [Oscillospiraceae bacterium]